MYAMQSCESARHESGIYLLTFAAVLSTYYRLAKLLRYMDFDYTFPALVVARALLAFAPLPDALNHSQQLSSPLTSYTRRMFKSTVYPDIV